MIRFSRLAIAAALLGSFAMPALAQSGSAAAAPAPTVKAKTTHAMIHRVATTPDTATPSVKKATDAKKVTAVKAADTSATANGGAKVVTPAAAPAATPAKTN